MWVAADTCFLPRRVRPLAGLLAAAAVLLAAGCSKTDHGDRVPLSGTVKVQGQPLDVRATLYLDPVNKEHGSGASSEVSGGKFELSEETGPSPGMQFKATLITSPGIPADNTPRDQIKVSHTYEKVVEIPARGTGPVVLDIDFDKPPVK